MSENKENLGIVPITRNKIETIDLEGCDCGLATRYFDGKWICPSCGSTHKKVKKFPRLKTWELVFVDYNCEWCNEGILETSPRGSYSRKQIYKAKQDHLKENFDCLVKQIEYDEVDN